MSKQVGRFKCAACGATFDSSEELERHNTGMQAPQPTLPTW